ncbi:MAG: stalk domain-containing protein, partial [Peptococcaceae bacterium]|nr:stalk domain-containing protein [Peptococcaceae bacterium]
GDGAQGYANRNLIGIEIARSAEESGDRFRRAEENAALYIAHVCVQYGWTSAQLHQHNWYSATECPHRTKTHWSDFLAKVDENIATIKASGEDHPAPSVPQVTLIALGKALDVPAENRNGTVYAPVRALCEALGFDVEWKDGEVMIA